ncbi:hypothetical protein COLO4_36628 [Corchorus olitorius]|uniref:Uncharacterized protein n=1 Tax=Corchorus olitorius TaxID=93759 RepID=A0A1R3G767_9ROSI|nr:hypothetical protein COLO4_36628 [Corchorus olitorius]
MSQLSCREVMKMEEGNREDEGQMKSGIQSEKRFWAESMNPKKGGESPRMRMRRSWRESKIRLLCEGLGVVADEDVER